jgi:holin-like protein
MRHGGQEHTPSLKLASTASLRPHRIGRPQMIRGMATVLGFQLAGELIARLGHLPVSGPICGMAALLAWLYLRGEVEIELGKVCDGILANMAILFVPVGVGAMSYSSLFASAWPVIVLAIVVGSVATLLTAALVTRFLFAWTASPVTAVEERQPAIR